MRDHPIPPVTEPRQYRAIGVVRGRYVPDDPAEITRGRIETEDGTAVEAVVLGRVLSLMRRHLDLDRAHLWVAYPRCRDSERLHLQIVGVWEPSTLRPETPGVASDSLPEGDDYFSIRGELIFTRPETDDLVVRVRQQPRADGSRPAPFKVPLKGHLPLEHLRHFVALDVRRHGQQLVLERCEVIAPMPRRGQRGGRSRAARSGRGERSSDRFADRSARPPGESPQAPPRSSERVTRPLPTALTRPSR
jgi:hypothetical protein